MRPSSGEAMVVVEVGLGVVDRGVVWTSPGLRAAPPSPPAVGLLRGPALVWASFLVALQVHPGVGKHRLVLGLFATAWSYWAL
jgi:hypothetical protein